MSAAYVIVDMQVSNMEQYKQYMADAPATIKAAGGEYVIRGGRFESLEGEWEPARLAMVKFPSWTVPSFPAVFTLPYVLRQRAGHDGGI